MLTKVQSKCQIEENKCQVPLWSNSKIEWIYPRAGPEPFSIRFHINEEIFCTVLSKDKQMWLSDHFYSFQWCIPKSNFNWVVWGTQVQRQKDILICIQHSRNIFHFRIAELNYGSSRAILWMVLLNVSYCQDWSNIIIVFGWKTSIVKCNQEHHSSLDFAVFTKL